MQTKGDYSIQRLNYIAIRIVINVKIDAVKSYAKDTFITWTR